MQAGTTTSRQAPPLLIFVGICLKKRESLDHSVRSIHHWDWMSVRNTHNKGA